MIIFKKFISLPFSDKLELIFYPILLLYRMPTAWGKSLLATRVLLANHVENYHGFCPMMSLNNLFYKTISLNIWRYGRYQNSPCIGLGNYPVGNWFHISKPAILIYAKFGAVTTFISTLLWVISHLIWLK